MGRDAKKFFETHTEPVARRIATGLHKVGLAMKQQSWLLANEDGLSATQGQILAALVAHGALTTTELGARLGLKLPTVSESVRALIDKELVEKTPDPRHARALLIAPTRRGRALGTKARAWPEFLADAVESLSESEQATFFLGIVKMIHTLQLQGLIPTGAMCTTCTHFRPHAHTGARPHHCAFVDAPMAEVHVRLDCAEHAPASEEEAGIVWQQFARP